MMEVLSVNQLIQWKDGRETPLTERILWIDEKNIIAYVIDIFADSGFPIERAMADILEALENGNLALIKQDPMLKLIKEEDIKDKNRQIRERAWDIISNLVGDENELYIYQRESRGVLISKVVEEYSVTHMTVYKYLRKYWQRGKNKNALLPDYDNSGGKGKRKTLGSKKVGRPRKNADIEGIGINVDEETKKIFRIAINRYYNTAKQNTIAATYEMMLKDFYAEDYRYDSGVWKPILIPSDQIPTCKQLQYWLEEFQVEDKSIKTTIIARKGAKKAELQHRAILGKSDTDVKGPGSRYQIDATIGDVYLVSRYNRKWIIGRPVIYVVIDVFSRMVTGIYVGLEGPSWIGGMMALANASMDKVKFCSEYDIPIEEEQWPCHHVPEAILGDNGEMECKLVNKYIQGLQVKIENTPPYRADWKGIVEQNFHTINGHVKPLLPGVVMPDFRERGSKDYRLDAKLDIYQFTQIIIRCVLYHNNQHWLQNYDRNETMIEDEVSQIPKELWKWGIKNRSGRLRTFPEDIIKLNLMPSANGRVTAKGIKFENMHYSCETAIRELWFERARNRKSWELEVSYDPRNMNQIYIRAEDGRTFESCYLLEVEKRYRNKSLEEIQYLFEVEKCNGKMQSGELLQSKIDLISDIEAIVKNAEKITNAVIDKKESKASRLKAIKQNRKIEKELNREKEAFDLSKEEIETEVLNKVLPIKSKDEDGVETENDIELLKRMQSERLNGRNNR